MPNWITQRQFHEAEGIEDWRTLANGVCAHFAAGGHLVTDQHAPAWRVLADAEGDEACVASWMARD
jgi:hypothetical protein